MKRRPGGFSLIETMIAMVLGLLLLAATTRLFLLQRRVFRLTDALGRLQETGRFALELLARDVRMAGLRGCAGSGPVRIDASPPAAAGFPGTAVTGHEGGAAPDRLTVRRAATRAAPLARDMASPWSPVALAANPGGIGHGDLVLVADCAGADVFRVTSDPPRRGAASLAHLATGNRDARLRAAYRRPVTGRVPGARVSRLLVHRYSITDTGRRNPRGGRVTALARNGHDLFEGVETMQLRFGVSRAGQPVRYLPADRVTRWKGVVAVRVGLLLRSRAPLRSDPDRRIYRVAGTRVGPPGAGTPVHHPADHRLRRVMTATVALREPELP